MATDQGGKPPTRVSLGRVYQNGWPLMARHGLELLVLAVLIGWLPAYIIRTTHVIWTLDGRFPVLKLPLDFALSTFYAALSLLMSMTTAHLILANQRNPMAALSDSAQAGVRSLAGLVPLTLILSGWRLVAQFVGLLLNPAAAALANATAISTPDLISNMAAVLLGILVIIAAALVSLLWVGVAGVVLIEEDGGFLEALRRANILLRGQRWRLLAVALPVPTIMIGLRSTLDLLAQGRPQSLLGQLVHHWAADSFLNALSTVTGSVFLALFYRELIRSKDGNRASKTAAIFD